MSNANEPASPRYYLSQNRDGEYQLNTDGAGLTKRETMAMHIIASAPFDSRISRHDIARLAIERADALLAELARTWG